MSARSEERATPEIGTSGPAAPLVSPKKPGEPIDLDFDRAPLKDVLETLAKQGLNFVYPSDSVPGIFVTVRLKGVTVADAARAVCRSVGWECVVEGTIATLIPPRKH